METIPPIIHKSWHPHIQHLFEQPDIKKLKYEILPNCKFYPQSVNIFRTFNMPLDKVRIVILGQDPYPKRGQANGLAFAVNQDTPMPYSLRIIQKELLGEIVDFPDLKINNISVKEWKTLEHWWAQGVMLLNTSLTVKAGQVGSHTQYWEDFIAGVIDVIAREVKPIWLLWGSQAKGMGAYIFEHHAPDRVKGAPDNRTMSCSHPANEGRGGGFLGCNHFHKVNEVLSKIGSPEISW